MAKKTKIDDLEKAAPESPVRFSELFGHEAQVRFLSKAIARGALPQTILVTGPDGVGKSLLARMSAAALECERPASGACGECGPCRKVARGIHPDVRYVRPEGLTESGKERSQIRIEQVRDEILAPMELPPYEGKKLVVVVDPAEALNESAQNALLKSLEEPPAYVQFVLVSGNASGLLPTIRSRCHEVALAPVSGNAMKKALALSGIPGEEWDLAMAMAAGAPGRLSAYDKKESEFRRATLLALLKDGLEASAYPDLAPALEKLAKENPRDVFSLATGLVRDALRLQRGAAPRFHADLGQVLAEASKRRGLQGLQRVSERLCESASQLAYNVNPRLLWEWVFLVP